jgi:hypothetical protein
MGYDEEVDKIMQITESTGGATSGILHVDFKLSCIEIQLELREVQ